MKHFLAILASFMLFAANVTPVTAQGMMYPQASSSSASADEQTGQSIYNQLQNKQLTCDQLSDDDFDKLGDFYMWRMMGDSHQTMDQFMENRFGSNDNRQIHITMAKRLSGCDPNATYPASVATYAPLPWMAGMMGSNAYGGWSMMGGYYAPWAWVGMWFGWVVFLALAFAALAWWLKRSRVPNSPLDILKTRYAKGEISKDEFEKLKQDMQ